MSLFNGLSSNTVLLNKTSQQEFLMYVNEDNIKDKYNKYFNIFLFFFNMFLLILVKKERNKIINKRKKYIRENMYK